MKKINFKSIKSFAIGFIVGASLLSTGSVFANAITLEKIQAYLNHDISIVYNDKEVLLTNAPITYNGKTYLPLTDVGKLTNTSVKWNQKERSVEMTNESNNIEVEVLDNYFSKTDNSFTNFAIKVGEEIYVPIADGAKEYGIFSKVNYETSTSTISISNSDLTYIASDEIAPNVPAFKYKGLVLIKESILIEISKAS